jgi:hypothetical protein
MTFEITDYCYDFISRGDDKGLFNLVRFDNVSSTLFYLAYQNESGAYFFRKFETTGTEMVVTYYGVGKKHSSKFATDWANRATITYLEYFNCFSE